MKINKSHSWVKRLLVSLGILATIIGLMTGFMFLFGINKMTGWVFFGIYSYLLIVVVALWVHYHLEAVKVNAICSSYLHEFNHELRDQLIVLSELAYDSIHRSPEEIFDQVHRTCEMACDTVSDALNDLSSKPIYTHIKQIKPLSYKEKLSLEKLSSEEQIKTREVKTIAKCRRSKRNHDRHNNNLHKIGSNSQYQDIFVKSKRLVFCPDFISDWKNGKFGKPDERKSSVDEEIFKKHYRFLAIAPIRVFNKKLSENENFGMLLVDSSQRHAFRKRHQKLIESFLLAVCDGLYLYYYEASQFQKYQSKIKN